RHEECSRAEAMNHHLDAWRACQLPDSVYGCRVVVQRYVVRGELRFGCRQLYARPVIKQPHIETVCKEAFEHIGFDCVDRENQARDAETVGENYRSFGAPLVASQPQLNAIFGSEVMDFWRADAKHPLL